MICVVCGSEVAEGKKFCTVCGSPIVETPPETADSGTSLMGGFQGPPPSAERQYIPVAPLSPQPQQPAVDSGLIENILKQEEKKKRRENAVWTKPGFWLAASSLVFLPALLLPWLKLSASVSLGVFKLPLSFLITGRSAALPFISAGILLVAVFAACAGCAAAVFMKKGNATIMRAAAVVSIVMVVLSFLFALRSWSALDKDPESFSAYVQGQINVVETAYGKSGRFFGSQPGPADESGLTGIETGSGIMFVRRTLGLGVFFALLGGVAVFASTTVFAKKLKFASYTIAPTPMAAIIIGVVICVALFFMRFYAPGAWLGFSATVYQTVGKRDSEEAALRKCVSLPAPPLSCEVRLGRLLFDTKRKGDAMKIFKHISHRYPDYVGVDKYIGLIYFVWRDYPSATHHLKRFLKKYPSDIEVRKKLADSLNILGNEKYKKNEYHEALVMMLEAYELLPAVRNDPAVNYKIATIYNERGDYGKAAIYYARAAEIRKSGAGLYLETAVAYANSGDYKTAMQYFEKCVAEKPDYLVCYRAAGDVCRDGLKDRGKAREWFQRGLDVDDTGPDADELRKRIETLD